MLFGRRHRRGSSGILQVTDADGNILITAPLAPGNVDQWTGTPLTPGDPERCLGNGQHDGYPMCCDECEYLAACNPVSSD